MDQHERADELVDGRRPPFAVISKVLFPVALAVCVGFVALPRSWHMGGWLVVVRPWVPWALFLAPVVCLVVLLIGVMVSRARYAGEHAGCTFGVVALAFVCTLALRGLFSEGAWELKASLRGPDDQTYVLFSREDFFIGSTQALGRLTGQSPFHRSVQLLGKDSSWDVVGRVLVVRPARLAWLDGYRLVFAPSGELLVLWGRNWLMYYDPASGTFLADRQLTEISPFILLDETADLNAADVDAILEWIRLIEDDPRLPKRRTLVEALEHPNPHVRAAAREMLDAFDGTDAGAKETP